jgi:hypothetical protein
LELVIRFNVVVIQIRSNLFSRTLFFCCYLLGFTTVLAAQAKPKVASFIDTTSNFYVTEEAINLGFPEWYDLLEKPLADSIIQVDTISAEAFTTYRKLHQTKPMFDKRPIPTTDSTFTLTTKDTILTFQSREDCMCATSSYLGKITDLNLFVVNTIYMQDGYASTSLIDAATGKKFVLPACTDQGSTDVSLSPNDQFLITYANNDYERDYVCVYIFKIAPNKKTQRYNVAHHLTINIDQKRIVDFVWIDSNTLALKVQDLTPVEGEEEMQEAFYFLKIKFPKSVEK